MKKIGITVGTEEYSGNIQYFKKNKNKFSVLEGLIDTSNGFSYDYAIYAECKALEKKYKIEVIPLDGKNLDLKICNSCDYIFCIYEGTFNFMYYGLDNFNHYIKTLKKTKAKVYPSIKIQEFILYKNRYMKYLDKKGYPIIDTKYIPVKRYISDKSKMLDSIEKFIDENDYKRIIIKPELAGFKHGVKIYKNISMKNIKKHLDFISKSTEYKHLLLQPFLENFNKTWEIKTYWILGKHIFSYGQKVKGDDFEFTKPKSKGGKLDDTIVNKVLKMGKEIIKDLFKDHESLIQCRLDFALNDNNEYVINEIEICPTLSLEDSNKPYFHLIAEGLVNKCLQ